ncbi:MAG TPA: porin [Telluria sp.]|nr:porin [Telluria sp.]
MYAPKKLVLAVSIACVFPFAAQAQDGSTVQIYGKLYPEIVSYRESGGTAPGTQVSTLVKAPTAAQTSVSGTAMESSNSYIGFRGSEDLGGGMKAIFQLEGAIGVDDGTSKGGVLFNRDTFVGLSGGFGTLKLGGRMDTVYKSLADQIGFFGVGTGNFVSGSNIIAQGGFGSSNNERFHERPSNTVLYASPEYAGFQGLAGYSLGEVVGSASKGNIASVGGKYQSGPLYLALGYEEHIGLFGGSSNVSTALSNLTTAGANSNDTSTRLTAQYAFNTGTRIEGDYARTKLSETGGLIGHFQEYRHNSWLLSADQELGAWTLATSYGRSASGSCALVGGAACSTSGLDASMLSFGASYTLSKRARLFALYSNLLNGYSADFNNASTAPAPGVGQSLRQLATGISLRF